MPLKPETPLEHLVAEIFTSEASYLASLEQFIAATNDEKIFGNNEAIQKQRAEIQNMILLSKALLSLTQDMTVIPTTAQVAEFFNKNGQFLKIYEPYAISFSEYSQELLKNNEKLNNAINNNLKGNLAENITITPIQRIPRYRLLLEELLKRTPNTAPEHANVSTALETVKVRATAINEIKRSVEQSDNAKAFLKKTPNKLIEKAVQNKTGTEIETILKYAQQLNILKKNRKFYNKNKKDYDKLIKQVENIITYSFTAEKEDRIEPNHETILQALEAASKPKVATAQLTDATNTITSQITLSAQQTINTREKAREKATTVTFHETQARTQKELSAVIIHENKKQEPVVISDKMAAELALLKEPAPIIPSRGIHKPESKTNPAPNEPPPDTRKRRGP